MSYISVITKGKGVGKTRDKNGETDKRTSVSERWGMRDSERNQYRQYFYSTIFEELAANVTH